MVYTVVWKTVMKVSKCETNDPLKDILISSHTGDFIAARTCKCHCLFLMLTWSSDKLNFPFFYFAHIIWLKWIYFTQFHSACIYSIRLQSFYNFHLLFFFNYLVLYFYLRQELFHNTSARWLFRLISSCNWLTVTFVILY